MKDLLRQLVPMPRRCKPGTATLRLERGLAPGHEATGGPPASAGRERPQSWLGSALEARQLLGGDAPLEVLLALRTTPRPGWYSLRIQAEPDRIQLEAGDEQGLFSAVACLLQLLDLAHRPGAPLELPQVEIEDWPLFQRRGFMLDVSRDRVPTMSELKVLIEQLASLRYNELQLYVEHTFAYPGHETVWRGASPLTAEELRELDQLCASRGIALVPNQNCLGHWHRWLSHDEYRHLAEVPEGIEHPFHLERQPFSLQPGSPEVLGLLEGLLDEYLPLFGATEFNAGLDETDDIGQGASRERCAELGAGRVYLQHLQAIHARVRDRGRRMQFWGDIIVRHPDLVPELPADAIALEWGYEAGHPFEEHSALFASSGLDFHVCPGTSSWQSLTGRLGNLRENLREAAEEGERHGARGYLVTDWGDFGHWQPAAVSWPGILLGASQAWRGEEPEAPLELLLSRTFLEQPDHELCRLLLDLARVSESSGCRVFNGTPFFFLLKFVHEPLSERRIPHLDRDGLRAAGQELEGLMDRASALSGGSDLAARHARELAWAAATSSLACNLGEERLAAGPGLPVDAVPTSRRLALAHRLEELVRDYRESWLLRSRPGGLEDSCSKLLHTSQTLRRSGPTARA